MKQLYAVVLKDCCGLEGTLLYSLCESSIFGLQAFFGMDVCTVFPQGVLAITPLTGGMTAVMVTTACSGLLHCSLLS